MRSISAPALSALAADVLNMVVLVEMRLTQTVRMSTANITVTYAGQDFLGLGSLGTIAEIEDSPGEFKNITFTLSGVPVEILSLALSENIRNKPVIIRLGVLNRFTFEVLDAPIVWSGTLEQMPIQVGKETAIINVTAEHRGVTFGRSKPLSYTHNDQQRLFSGDTSLKTIQAQSTHNDVWPAAEYFRI